MLSVASLLTLVLCLVGAHWSKAQRVRPCFTGPPSCEQKLEGYDLALFIHENPLSLFDTCFRLGAEVFDLGFADEWEISFNLTGFDMQTAWTALSDIPAGSKFCNDALRFVNYCEFCGFYGTLDWSRDCGFYLDPPSCDDYQGFSNSDDELPPFAREVACEWLESEFLLFSGVEDIFNETQRNDALLTMRASPGYCDTFRQAYAHCYWCDPSIQDISECAYDSIFDESGPEVLNNNGFDVEESCSAIESVITGDINQIRTSFLDRFMTWDLCQRARQVAPKHCTGVCHSCFNETYPPMCVENPDELPPETTEIIFDVSEIFHYLSPFGSGVAQDSSVHLNHLKRIRASHPMCSDLRDAYSFGWWCDPPETAEYGKVEYCSFGYCAEVSVDLSRPTYVPYNGTDRREFQAYCSKAQDLFGQNLRTASTIDLCHGQSLYAEGCLCVPPQERNIDEDYLGADTKSKKQVLVWTSRASAILSFVGACYIALNVKQKTERHTKMKVYHQLVLGMAAFDVVTAVAWGFATLPINDDEGYDIYGARGTDASCKAQGFFIQLGFASIFYNVSLATYYYLVVQWNWKESQLRKISTWLHVPPIVLGLALSFGSLPFYEGFDYACHLLPYPSGDLRTVLVFAVVPISLSILIVSVVMVRMYVWVRAQSWSSNERSLGFGGSAKIEQMVFWQALFYTVSFYITWPIVLCVYVTGWDFEKKNFGFSVVVALVAPLQGFNNFLVYARPRIAKCLGHFIERLGLGSIGRRRSDTPNESSILGARYSTRKSYDTPMKSSETPVRSSETPLSKLGESRDEEFSDFRRRYSSRDFDPSVAIAEDDAGPRESTIAAELERNKKALGNTLSSPDPNVDTDNASYTKGGLDEEEAVAAGAD